MCLCKDARETLINSKRIVKSGSFMQRRGSQLTSPWVTKEQRKKTVSSHLLISAKLIRRGWPHRELSRDSCQEENFIWVFQCQTQMFITVPEINSPSSPGNDHLNGCLGGDGKLEHFEVNKHWILKNKGASLSRLKRIFNVNNFRLDFKTIPLFWFLSSPVIILSPSSCDAIPFPLHKAALDCTLFSL